MHGSAPTPDWSSIDTVLLDLDGTLLDLRFDILFWEELLPLRFAETRGVSLDEARRLMRPVYHATHGTLDWYCVDYWSRALGFDIVALKRSVRHQIAWLPHSREFLARLRAAGRRVVLVTNAHPEILAIKDAQLDIRRRFDAVYSSRGIGTPKENPDFWPLLARQEPFNVRRTLFADDTPAVLHAADAHGIGWLYAVQRPSGRGPPRPNAVFPGVDSVHQLAAGLEPRAAEAQPAGP